MTDIEATPAHRTVRTMAEMARAGVGYSDSPSSRQAGAEAARTALEGLGGRPADLVLLFQTAKHDPAAFHDGVRSVVGVGEDPRLVGGYAVGIITNDYLGYEGHQVGVAAIAAPSMEIDVFAEGDLQSGEHETGRTLGKQIRDTGGPGNDGLLLIYDAIKGEKERGFDLNMATPLLQGMAEGMGVGLDAWPTAAGVGMLGDLGFKPIQCFLDDEVAPQRAMTLRLGGGVRMHTAIMHGCRPAGRYYTITKSEGPVVLELDDRPALEVINEMLGGDRSWEEYPLFVTLGLNKGDKFEEYDEEKWANRLCMGVDEERQGLIMFEPDLVPGMEVQLMRRAMDFEYIGKRTEDLLASLEGRRPFFALYIDCAGRASAYCGTEREEAEEVQKQIGDIPLLGFYSGVEIAQVGGEVQALDWTGVLCVFSEEA